MIRPPPIDRRTAKDIAGQLYGLLNASEWKGADEPGDFGDALVQIFARYAEIVIERLNRAPEKNLLAYLDMLGASLQPPQPARVPLAFELAAGSTADAVVPAATQAAAPPAEGEIAPVIFETERELTVVAASLDKIFVREVFFDRDNDKWKYRSADLSNLCSAVVSGARRAFTGAADIDHSLYIGLDRLLGRTGLSKLHIQFGAASPSPPLDPQKLLWSLVDEAGKETTLTADTAGLAETGQVSFSPPTAVPQQSVNGLRSRWLRGSLQTPIAPGESLPEVELVISADLSRQGVPIALAFANTTPLDVTKDFLPFGEKPRLGDTLYLSAGDAFSWAGASVTLDITLSEGSTPQAEGNPVLKWEYWTHPHPPPLAGDGAGERWAPLPITCDDDATAALTKSGEVTFTLDGNPAMLAVGGVDGCWVRVRIAGGNYGEDAKYKAIDPDDSTKGYEYIPPTLAPPSIAAITVAYVVSLQDQKPDRIMTCNDFDHQPVEVGKAFKPFRPTADEVPTLYFGFALPNGRQDFPNRPVSLFLGIDEPLADTPTDNRSATEPARLVWECAVGKDRWERPGLRDGTHGLTRSGVLEFLAPTGFALRDEFGVGRYWLRCRWEVGAFAYEPRLRRVVLNAVMAEQASTILDETLGSSDGSQGQRFATARRPILHGREELRVREPELPSADERAALALAGGEDALAVMRDAAGRPIEIWVRWQEVPDFYGSGSRDRYYVLDHMAGTVVFGDGINGLIPPPGAGNLRIMRYRTGGGSAGNRDADTIVQLTTTIPFVASVTNPEPARGGADAETLDALLERAPRAIRHGDRAVTVEDYEDLAMLASPEVARAKCVPLYDLLGDRDSAQKRPGTVSVIVVPRTTEAKPLPSLVLLDRVAAYLDARRLPVVDLKVVGPDYVRVDIKAEIALTAIDSASAVHSGIVGALQRFLHPLTGGFDGAGWDFGRSPQISDLVRVIGAICGVDHIRSLTARATSDRGDDKNTARSLVYPGALDITVMSAAPENVGA